MVQVKNLPYLTLRFKFYKKGALQYISHLDLVRTMHKIIVRAGFPLWYTEGFNPKPKLIFGAPLSIGCESECEFLDVRITERIDAESAVTALNRLMTDEMQVTEAYYTETKFQDMAYLGYDFRLTLADGLDSMERIAACLAREEILIEKQGKSGKQKVMKTVNIRPQIRSAEVFADGETICIRAVLSSDPSDFLNPEHLVSALKRECGILREENLARECYSILRTHAYQRDMTPFR
ncbi:MAG: DUF2344 domain-containing protein [Clostridia bacterium]|nr:DUF2344 domain-containing protein [Clostridia bacterium]